MIKPITLNADELHQVIERVAPTGKEYAAARICRMLADNHSVVTVNINSACSVGNISDIVSKGINPRIRDLNLYVACMRPPRQIYNKFNQPTGQMLWSFYRDTAANDPAYHPEHSQNAVRDDSGDLRHQGQDQCVNDLFGASESFKAATFDQDAEAANQHPMVDCHAGR